MGQVMVAFEALRQLVPHTWIDTTGCAFTFPMARLAGSKVACYVHYPTISMDMLHRVRYGLQGSWGFGVVVFRA